MNASIDLNELSRQLIVVMGHFLWQGAVVGALAWVAALALKSAAARYVTYVGGLLLMGVCPVATWFVLVGATHAVPQDASAVAPAQHSAGVVARAPVSPSPAD